MSEFDETPESSGLPEGLRDPFGTLRRRWKLMLAVFLLGASATVAFVMLAIDPKFAATATVMMSSQRIPDRIVDTTPDNPFERINAIVGEVLSRDELLELAEKYGLLKDRKDPAAVPSVIAAMRGAIEIEAEAGIGNFSRREASRIFAITYRDDDPQLAAAMANDLAGRFVSAHLRQRSQQARLTTQFLRRELEKADLALREQSGLITEYKKQYIGELPGQLDTNLRKLERLQAQKQSLEIQISEAETRLLMVASSVDTSSLATPEGRLADLRARFAEAVAVYTPEHPNVLALRRQLEAAEREVASGGAPGSPAATRSALVAASRRTIGQLRAQLAEADAEIRAIDARVARAPERQEELTALEEKASVLQESYVEFLRKVNEAELAETLESAQQGERVSIVDRAAPPQAPETKRPKFLAAGLLASLMLAAGVGFLREVMDPVLTDRDQLESSFDLPVLGAVPRIS